MSSQGTGRIETAVLSVLRAQAGGTLPVVTLSWARTAAGAIAAADGVRTAVSGSESLVLTHRLRAMHGAILVGVQTVLSDNPLLSVRLVDGKQPRPIVLDSRLRTPAAARLLSRADMVPWIFHAENAQDTQSAAEQLERAGARLFTVPCGPWGLELAAVLAGIRAEGIDSLMVEGGARVLESFIASALAAQAVITTSPSRMEGIPGPAIPPFIVRESERYGADTVLWGKFPPG
ncbi:MAG: RibD family protein [Spirochaetia bacterium]